jgi:putative sigma-54 modulation protein
MQIEISGQNLEVTPALKEMAMSKVDRVAHHMDSITSIHITFKVEKHQHIAEGQVLIPQHAIHAEASTDDSYKSLDQMIDKLIRQITKHKEKMTGRR